VGARFPHSPRASHASSHDEYRVAESSATGWASSATAALSALFGDRTSGDATPLLAALHRKAVPGKVAHGGFQAATQAAKRIGERRTVGFVATW